MNAPTARPPYCLRFIFYRAEPTCCLRLTPCLSDERELRKRLTEAGLRSAKNMALAELWAAVNLERWGKPGDQQKKDLALLRSAKSGEETGKRSTPARSNRGPVMPTVSSARLPLLQRPAPNCDDERDRLETRCLLRSFLRRRVIAKALGDMRAGWWISTGESSGSDCPDRIGWLGIGSDKGESSSVSASAQARDGYRCGQAKR